MSPSPAQADRIQRRQVEKLVSWTLSERLRCMWYRLCLTIQEMNYANAWTVDCRIAAHQADVTRPARDHH
jgi:hypothetical protein